MWQKPSSQAKAGVPGTEYQAPDGSLSCRIPAGWTAHPTTIGGTTVQVLEPQNGGEERILVSATPATANSLQDLAQQAVMFVTGQLLPGFRVADMPKFTQQDGVQVAEITYVGTSGSGQALWWHGLMLKDGMALGVLGGARVDRAPAVEQVCRDILRSLRPGKAAQNATPSAAILGKWTFYDRSSQTRGSVSKQIVFYPNGR